MFLYVVLCKVREDIQYSSLDSTMLVQLPVIALCSFELNLLHFEQLTKRLNFYFNDFN